MFKSLILIVVTVCGFSPVTSADHLGGVCYEDLQNTGKLTDCKQAAEKRWNLNSNATSLEDSCCAMYDSLNCAFRASCSTCSPVFLQQWAMARMRSLTVLSGSICSKVDYVKDYSKICKRSESTDSEVALPFEQHCANELSSTSTTEASPTESSRFLWWLIILILLLVVILPVGVLMCIFIYCAFTRKAPRQQQQLQSLAPAQASFSPVVTEHPPESIIMGSQIKSNVWPAEKSANNGKSTSVKSTNAKSTKAKSTNVKSSSVKSSNNSKSCTLKQSSNSKSKSQLKK